MWFEKYVNYVTKKNNCVISYQEITQTFKLILKFLIE
jgi:hypothetical protein